MQYHEVRLHFEFNTLNRVCCYTGDFKENGLTSLNLSEASVLVDYVYLDSEERRRFAQVGHEYLIEQLQFTGEESVQNSSHKYRLNFNHPTKEIVWACKHGDFADGNTFLAYTHLDDWSTALDTAAENLALGSLDLVAATGLVNDAASGSDNSQVCNSSTDASATDVNGVDWTTSGASNLEAGMNMSDVVLKSGTFDLISRISAVSLTISSTKAVTITSVTHNLTIRDISRALDRWGTNNINTWVTNNKLAVVNQHHNYGLNLDGSKNPVNEALLQLNGHDRFDKREGAYFNYVQPNQVHTRSPVDGVNVYSFALKPEQHQPSGTANLSRIDTTQLNLWFTDGASSGNSTIDGFTWDFLNDDTKVYIYAFSYNVLRIMSGMGGLAYSN